MSLNQSKTTRLRVIAIITLLVLVALLGWIINLHSKCVSLQKENEALLKLEHYSAKLDSTYTQKISIEEAVNMFIAEKISAEEYEVYVSLHPIIVKEIFTKLGTELTVHDIVKEYNSNKTYYLGLLISSTLPEVNIEYGKDKIKSVKIIPELDSSETKIKIQPNK